MSNALYELPWSGTPFRGADFLAFDTETAIFDRDGREYDLSREIQPLVLATVSDGTRNAVLFPEQVWEFICAHCDTLIVGFNMQFDYWVVRQHLLRDGHLPTAQLWELMAEQNQMDDAMLLDFLVRLADPSKVATDGMRNLGQVAKAFGLEADKKNPYRLRFHELLGTNYLEADRGFYDYATEDTYVTWHVYYHLKMAAGKLAYEMGVPPDQYYTHGPLTSRLQTRASIVLAQIGRNGMGIDQSKVETVKGRLRGEVDAFVEELAKYDPPLFRYYVKNPRTGERRVNKRTLVPNLDYGALRTHLMEAAALRGVGKADLPKTPKGDVATRLDAWKRIAGDAPIVQTWSQMADRAKVLQFVAQVDGAGTVHPGYRPCVRTGRASCVSPNIMQMPKERWFRELFVPRPGHKYVIVDYSAIELRTLAAVLLDTFGESQLAEVLKDGICPHTYTASIVTCWPYEEIKAGVKAEKTLPEPGKYTKARQAAKAINFGVPGGLGAARLCSYARLNYGVDMTEEQAKQLKNTLIYEVYPELARYLDYDIYDVLAHNLHADEYEIRDAMEQADITYWHVERVLRRDGRLEDGKQLPIEVRAHVWDTIERLNNNPALNAPIAMWASDTRGLCGETVRTLTGRIRAGVDYGEARNTRFQGLAADGAKIALWRLHQFGYRIVAFIHDEIVCEVPEGENAEWHLEQVGRIMKESMATVLKYPIPVEVEGAVADSWTK